MLRVCIGSLFFMLNFHETVIPVSFEEDLELFFFCNLKTNKQEKQQNNNNNILTTYYSMLLFEVWTTTLATCFRIEQQGPKSNPGNDDLPPSLRMFILYAICVIYRPGLFAPVVRPEPPAPRRCPGSSAGVAEPECGTAGHGVLDSE